MIYSFSQLGLLARISFSARISAGGLFCCFLLPKKTHIFPLCSVQPQFFLILVVFAVPAFETSGVAPHVLPSALQMTSFFSFSRRLTPLPLP